MSEAQAQDANLLEDAFSEIFNELASLEKEFDSVEVEIMRQKALKEAPLFLRRSAVTRKIPNFWTRIFEEAATSLGFDDQFSAEDGIVLGYLYDLVVTRPHCASGGDPRDVDISFSFLDNEYLEAQTVTKSFRFTAVTHSAFANQRSEPVTLKWKKGKDLTGGVLDAAVSAFEERKKGKGDRKEGKKLAKLCEKHQTFFNFFGFTGLHKDFGETEEEEKEEEEKKSKGKEVDDENEPVEAFYYGGEIAVQIADDIYPNAVKYFTDSLEEANDDDEASLDIEESDLEDLAASGIEIGSSSMGALLKGKKRGADGDGDTPAKKKSKK